MGYILTTYFLHTPPPYGHPLYLRGGSFGGHPCTQGVALGWVLSPLQGFALSHT